MTNAVGRLLVGGAALLLVAGTARAQQVTIGPLSPSGTQGQEVDFQISYTGPTDTNGISFNMIYGAAQAASFTPIFRSGSTTKVTCTTASDLDPGITTSAVVLSSGKIGFTVIGLSLDTGPIAFGRTGVLGTCKFMATAAATTVPLPCDTSTGATTASDVNGNNLTVACVDGTLTIAGGNTNTPTPTTGPTTDVTIGPLEPSGMQGQEVDFNISYTGPTDTNGISFNMIYGAAQAASFTPIFRSGSTTKVTCATASDLDPGITTSAVVLSSGKIGFTVIGLSLDTGPIAFGRTGVLGTCKFMTTTSATTVALPCDTSTGATTASDVNGNSLSVTCVDGTLTVGGPTVPPQNTPTATPSNTVPVVSTPTNTSVPATPTATKVASTATPTRTNTVSGTPGVIGTPESDSDGCQIYTGAPLHSGWLVLIPAVGLLVLRRRRR